MALARIPAGSFQMGSESGDRRDIEHDHPYSTSPGNLDPEEPAHTVKLTKRFAIGMHEVTVAQFEVFVEETGYRTGAEKDGGALGFFPKEENYVDRFHQDSSITWKTPGFEQTGRHPVVCVSWNDAQAFCQWLSEKEERTYRLPTEAEWEYACRAGTDGWYSFGNDPDNAYAHANVGDGALESAHPNTVRFQRAVQLEKEDGDGFVFTAPVGTFKPNDWGLHDLHGNVWEWTQDRYANDTYQRRLKGYSRQERKSVVIEDPQGMDSTSQHEYGDWRTIRGGSWFTAPVYTRCTYRAFAEASEASCYTGFRVVLVESDQ